MTEFYWITRLDAITITLGTILILCFLFGIVGIIAYFVFRTDAYADKAVERVNKTAYKIVKVYVPIIIVVTLLRVFIPTTKEALVIYGVGSTIDYLKSNDKAKQLPDKVVDAIDAYLESLKEDKK